MDQKIAIIFDMDGVLIDSAEINWKANNQVLSRYGFYITGSELSKYLGRTLRNQIDLINKDYSLSLNFEDFEREVLTIKRPLFANAKPKPGVIKLLDDLKAQVIPMAVGTSMPLPLTKERLTVIGIIQYFDVLVTEDQIKNHKPNPEVFLTAAERLGVSPDKCVVIEDALVGIEAAHSGDMKCCAVRTPYCSEEDLAKADLVIDSLETLTAKDLQDLISL